MGTLGRSIEGEAKGSFAVDLSKQGAFESSARRLRAISRVLKGNFTAGVPGLSRTPSEVGTSFNIGRSDLTSEKKAKLLAKFPKGDLMVIPIGGAVTGVDTELVTVFTRDTDNEPFRELDPPGPDLSGAAQIGSVIASEPVVGGTVGFLLGGPFLSAPMTIAGVFAQSGIEELQGFEQSTTRQVAQRAAIEGGVVLLADLSTFGVTRLIRAVRGGSPVAAFRQGEAAPELADIAQRRGLEPAVVGQTAESPVVRRVFSQAGGTSGSVRETAVKQSESLRKHLERIVERKGFDGLNDRELQTIVARHEGDLRRIISRRPPVDADKAGQGLEVAANAFKVSGGKMRDRNYLESIASAGDEPVFYNTAPLKNLGTKIERGTPLSVIPKVNTKTGAVTQTIRGEGPISKEAQSLLSDIQELTKTIETSGQGRNIVTAYEKIKALRQRAFDLMNSKDIREEAIGKRLYGKITGVMDNPVGGSEAFKRSYKGASVYNLWYETILRKKAMKGILTSEDPAAVANRYIKPGTSFSDIKFVKDISGEKGFPHLQEHFKATLLANPRTIGRQLDGWAKNPKGLELLMDKETQNVFREYGRVSAQFESGPVRRLLQADLTNAEKAIEMMDNRVTAAAFRRTIVASPGGRNGPLARSVKAGIWQKLLKDSSTIDPNSGRQIIDTVKFKRSIEALEKGDKTGLKVGFLFTKDDFRAARELNLYASNVGVTMDAGGQLQAATVASGAVNILNPLKAFVAYHTIARNAVAARILTTPTSRQALTRSSNDFTTSDKVRNIVAAAAIAFSEAGVRLNPGASPDRGDQLNQ